MATQSKNTRKSTRRTTPKTRTVDFKKMPKQAEKPAFVVLGMIASKPVAMMIDKITGSTENTVSGIFGIESNGLLKKWAKPVGLTVGGLALSQLVKTENIKMFGYGLAAGGAIIGVKEFWNKDLLALSGLDELNGVGGEIAAPSDFDLVLPENIDEEEIAPSQDMQYAMDKIEAIVSDPVDPETEQPVNVEPEEPEVINAEPEEPVNGTEDEYEMVDDEQEIF